jgi:hypothetical protein
MVSYAIQGAATMILGPILAFLILIFDETSSEDSFFGATPPGWLAALIRLASHHHRTNAVFGVSVMVASIIRISQLAPLAEVSFITMLSLYQFFMALASYTSMLVIFLSQEQSHGTWKLVFTSLYGIFLYISFFAILYMEKFPSSKSKVLEQITDCCVSGRGYPVPAVDFHELTPGFHIFFWPILTGLIASTAFLLWRFHEQIKRLGAVLAAVLEAVWLRFCRRIHVRPRRFAGITCIGFVVVYWGWCCITFFWILQTGRQDLRGASGSAYRDSEWGFGQVVAVLLWLPLFEEVIACGSGMYFIPSNLYWI